MKNINILKKELDLFNKDNKKRINKLQQTIELLYNLFLRNILL